MANSLVSTSIRGYGCQREVYHPLSNRAEATALIHYESSDEEDEVGVVGNSPLPAGAMRTVIATPSSGMTGLIQKEPPASPSPVGAPNALVVRKEPMIKPIPMAALVARKEPTAVLVKKQPTPKKNLPMMMFGANEDPVDRKGKGIEREPIFMLDEMAAMDLEKPALKRPEEPSSPVFKYPPVAITAPSTPPRQRRTPFSVLTPENTFGASSPFKTRALGVEKEQQKEKDKENGDNYSSIPGGFDGW